MQPNENGALMCHTYTSTFVLLLPNLLSTVGDVVSPEGNCCHKAFRGVINEVKAAYQIELVLNEQLESLEWTSEMWVIPSDMARTRSPMSTATQILLRFHPNDVPSRILHVHL